MHHLKACTLLKMAAFLSFILIGWQTVAESLERDSPSWDHFTDYRLGADSLIQGIPPFLPTGNHLPSKTYFAEEIKNVSNMSFINDTPFIISWPLARAYPGVEYNIRLGVIGGKYPYSFSLSDAPSGMSISEREGEIRWIPNLSLENRTFNVSVDVTDQFRNKASQSFSITVAKEGFYFVSGNGSDAAGDGTFEKPWRSLNFSVHQATTEDILYLMNGTYKGKISVDPGGINKWIAYPGCMPVIDLNLSVISPKDDYGLVDGLEIVNIRRWAFSFGSQDNWIFRNNNMHHLYDPSVAGNPSFIFFWDGGHHRKIIIQDNVFHDLFDRGSGINGDESANFHGSSTVMYDVSYSLIEDNIVYNIDGHGIHDKDNSYKNVIRGNYVHDVHDSGIAISNQYTAYNVEICYNILGLNTSGLRVGGQPQILSNISAYHNTILGSIDHHSGTPVGENDSVQFFDNIIYNVVSGEYPYRCCNSEDGGVFCSDVMYRDNNLIYTDKGYIAGLLWGGDNRFTREEWAGIGFDIHSIFKDPLFLDIEDGNFSPSGSSPACRAASDGRDIGAVPCSQIHEADLNHDGKVGIAEIRKYVRKWIRNGVSLDSISAAMSLWKRH